MRLFRLFVATVLLLGIGLGAQPAHAAGTLTWSPPIWTKRASTNLRPDTLNRADCQNDATVTFSIQVRGAVASGSVLEMWAGNGCDQSANRLPANKQCVQVTSSVSAITATSVQVRLQDMVKPYGSTDTPSAASCDLETSPSLVTRTLFFVVYNTGNNMSEAASNTWAFKYDVKAPAPPTKITAGSGEESLIAHFTAPTGESNLLKYKFYCSPVGPAPADTTSGGTSGTDSGGTGGTSGTSGTDTGTGGVTDGDDVDTGAAGTPAATNSQSDDPSCTSSILIPGQPAPSDAIYCGDVGAQGATQGDTSQVLENGIFYAVAVATEDNVNNIGVLSKLGCNTPMDIKGFYDAYRNAGGQAGGGFCAFGPARHGGAAALFAIALGATALLRRRR
jgi:hypothetical protein